MYREPLSKLHTYYTSYHYTQLLILGLLKVVYLCALSCEVEDDDNVAAFLQYTHAS